MRGCFVGCCISVLLCAGFGSKKDMISADWPACVVKSVSYYCGCYVVFGSFLRGSTLGVR